MSHRTRSAMIAIVAAALLAGCASTIVHPSPSTMVSPSLSQSPQPTPSLPSPSPTPTPSIPEGFQPEALTAISDTDFWVLSAAECSSLACGSEILHTLNAGKTFQRIAAPPATFLAGNGTTPGSPTISDIRFADAADGWVFGNTLWATHNGGAAWHQVLLSEPIAVVAQLEPGANGYVYAVFQLCANPSVASNCTFRLMRSHANSDAWSLLTPPGNPAGRPAIGVHGNTVWVMYFQGSTGVEWISHDDGVLWNRGSMPCEPDLGGNFDPVSTTVIWAFCATGNFGNPWVSSSGGATWTPAGGVGGLFSNGAMVAALSSQHAFVGGGGNTLAVSGNGGGTYQPIPELAGDQWAGFTDSEVGYAITLNEDNGWTLLWRTSDAGAHWTRISLP